MVDWWFAEPLRNFFGYFAEEYHIVSATEHALELCHLDAVQKLPRSQPSRFGPFDLFEFANRETANDFPTIHRHATVALWSAWEVAAWHLLADWVLVNRGVLKRPEFARVKIRLSRYESLDERERIRYLFDEAARELPPAETQFGTIEQLARICDFPLPHDADSRRYLIELCAFRNVLVHNAGRPDHKLRRVLKWREFTDDRVVITSNDIGNYLGALAHYACYISAKLVIQTGDTSTPIEEVLTRVGFPPLWIPSFLERMEQMRSEQDAP